MHPNVFCHVEGKEEVLAAATAEGSAQSRSNLLEAQKAVSNLKS